jgi:cytochrome c oxidase cbb3-type subunit III
MRSPCSSWRYLVPLAWAATALIGCSRESRHFEVTATGATESSLRMSELQPGTPTEGPPRSDPYAYNAYAISQGKRLFDWYNCSGCHAHGGGDIGPALMDDRWIYGDAPANIFATVMQGRPNGMPAFSGKLDPDQAWQLVAYVQSLSGQLSRDALPARSDHLFDKPGEQSLPRQPAIQSTLPPGSQQ